MLSNATSCALCFGDEAIGEASISRENELNISPILMYLRERMAGFSTETQSTSSGVRLGDLIGTRKGNSPVAKYDPIRVSRDLLFDDACKRG